jgi:glucose-1-phosphate adenylyltransferase
MEEITIVYKEIDDANKEFIGADVLDIDENGYLKDVHKNKGDVKKAKVSLQIWIINRKTLVEMIDHSNRVDSSWGIAEYLKGIATNDFIPTKIHCVPFNGYARRFDSLAHYVEYSFELLNRKPYETLFNRDWPIYTRTHDTPPAIYGTESEVTNSFISNGCVIEGTVKDSIICRGVKVKKGAKVTRSIVLSNCIINEGSALSDVVIDKYSAVAPRHKIQGDKEDVIYVKQGAKV